MSLIPLSLILSGLLALPAAAADSSPAADPAAPALVQLDQRLTTTLQDKAQGRLAPERFAEFTSKFRTDLAAAKAAAPPTSANTALYARILAKLDENNRSSTGTAPVLGSVDSRSAMSRTHFDEKTTPAVLAEEKAVLRSEPFRGGRSEPRELAVAGGSQQTRKILFVQTDSDTLPFKPSVKFSPAAAPPATIAHESMKSEMPPIGMPLGPMGVFGGLGLALGWLASKLLVSDAQAGTFAGTGATLGVITALVTMPAGSGRPAIPSAVVLRGDSPHVGLAPGGRPDCIDQLKKTWGLQRDAQDKRQSAIVMLQSVLDKYHLSYEQFQAIFPKILSGNMFACEASTTACNLRMDSRDWSIAQAAYGQVQALDRKLLDLSGLTAKMGDLCGVPDSDNKAPKKNSDNRQVNDQKTIDTPIEASAAEEAREPATSSSVDRREKVSSRKTGQYAVLGPYPSYVKLSEDMGSRYFSIPKEIWDKMSPDDRWAANLKFLDRAAARDEIFTLSIGINDVNPNSDLRKEIDYLGKLGYRITSTGRMLVRSVK